MSKLKQLIETANRKCEMAWKVYAFNPAKDNELAEESPVFQCIKKAAEYKRKVAEKHPDYIVEIVAESRQKNESWTDIYPILGNIGEKRYMNKQKELPRDLMEKEFRKALKAKGLKPTEHDIEYALYKYYEYYDESSQKNEAKYKLNGVYWSADGQDKLKINAISGQSYKVIYDDGTQETLSEKDIDKWITGESSQKNEDFRPDDIVPQSKQMDFKKQYMKNKDKRKVAFYFDGIHAVDDQSGSDIPGAVLGMKYKDLAAVLDKFFESAQKNENLQSEELDELIYHINDRIQHLDMVHKMSHNDLAKAIDANDLSKIKSILANCKSYIIAKEIVNTFDRAKKLANTMKKFSLEESAQKNETKHIYNEKGFVFEWDTNTGVIKTLKKPTNGYNLEYRSTRLLGETSEGIKLARNIINAHIKRIKEQPILT